MTSKAMKRHDVKLRHMLTSFGIAKSCRAWNDVVFIMYHRDFFSSTFCIYR